MVKVEAVSKSFTELVYFQVYGPYETSMMLQWSKAVSVTKPYMKYEIWLIKVLQDTMLQYSMRYRLHYQPLFGKEARAPPPPTMQTRHERAVEIKPI